MKKIPIITLSIAMLGAMFSLPANAHYVDEDNATWYTVQELLDYNEELELEKQMACGDDINCQQDYYYNKMESDSRVMALDQLMQQQFVLTAVNPGNGYIKMMFFGEDMMLKRMGVREELGIERVYIGWFEDNPERIYSFGTNFEEYMDKIDGLHTIYAWNNEYEEENLIKRDEEVTIEAKDLAENISGQLVYIIDSGPWSFNAVGRFIYTSCLNEPDYVDGVECQLMTSAEKGQAYFPPRNTVLNNSDDGNGISNDDTNSGIEILLNESDNDDLTIDAEINAGIDEGEQIDEKNTEKSETKFENHTEINANNDEKKGMKAPDTGSNTELCGQKVIEFPWWLGGLIVLGDVAAMWLFWPNRRKS